MKSSLATLTLALLLLPAPAPASPAGMHGGAVVSRGGHHFELLFKDRGIHVMPLGADGQPAYPRSLSGKLILRGRGRDATRHQAFDLEPIYEDGKIAHLSVRQDFSHLTPGSHRAIFWLRAGREQLSFAADVAPPQQTHGKGHGMGHGEGHGQGHGVGHGVRHGAGHGGTHPAAAGGSDALHGHGHGHGHAHGHGHGHAHAHGHGHAHAHGHGHGHAHGHGHGHGHGYGLEKPSPDHGKRHLEAMRAHGRDHGQGHGADHGRTHGQGHGADHGQGHGAEHPGS